MLLKTGQYGDQIFSDFSSGLRYLFKENNCSHLVDASYDFAVDRFGF